MCGRGARVPSGKLLGVLIAVCVVLVAAQPHCDPLTQYAHESKCCEMCSPGTSMASLGSCEEPQCKECEENEYQDSYNKDSKCRRQTYCDPNKNFQVPTHNIKRRTVCLCMVGFHCSTKECITCVPHTACKPGFGVLARGNHSVDTQCEPCAKGTFSDEESVDGACKRWTECGIRQYLLQTGTDTSDNVCEQSRLHTGAIISIVILVLLIIGSALYCLCRGKGGRARRKVKGCVESCLGEEERMEVPREAKVLITNPTDAAEEETSLPTMQSSQEETISRTPVEDDDELSQENSTVDVALTERGNFVTQENGKSEVLSRQESQTQTFTD